VNREFVGREHIVIETMAGGKTEAQRARADFSSLLGRGA